ncbi:MAG: GDP-mannose 4,6-dehydratase [Candidatus Omnitrophica bacterium]|nr:GDP-mannose 4,6-dehydratase [Candidatus Omnitrophota bacterium]MBU1995642.1 GDP-mannose 4,6-dehydratase [Candidatus Omnitrophota bacterium]MBU4334095.1 GDP-mannose 4,6-dehydratase [Candidatus Omnitrophota bacterium]
MKILITGGAGMVGSHCAEYFVKNKHKVTIIDNLMRSKIFGSDTKSVEYNWHYLKTIKNIKLIKKDVRDSAAMARIFKDEKPDAVIHAAGQPGVRYSLENPLEDCTINANGTISVLEALRKANKKGIFIYTSTNKVYGDNVNKVPIKKSKMRYDFKCSQGINENFSIDLTGHTPYGVSKLSGDLYAQDYAHAYGLKTGVFRMSCIYGTRQFGFEDQGWLAWLAIRYFLGKPITIYGDGKQIRDILWVEDLAKAFDSFIKSEHKSEVFNMGGGTKNTLSLLELTNFLEDISGKIVKINYADWRKFDQKVYVSDISKVKKLLKWEPSVSPREGVAKLYNWVSQNPKLFK